MSDLLTGKQINEAMSILESFVEVIQSKGKLNGDEEIIGDGVAFAGVSKFPARVKCALIGWMAFKDALSQGLAKK
jgi:nitrogen fixation NifU-like protein